MGKEQREHWGGGVRERRVRGIRGEEVSRRMGWSVVSSVTKKTKKWLASKHLWV